MHFQSPGASCNLLTSREEILWHTTKQSAMLLLTFQTRVIYDKLIKGKVLECI